MTRPRTSLPIRVRRPTGSTTGSARSRSSRMFGAGSIENCPMPTTRRALRRLASLLTEEHPGCREVARELERISRQGGHASARKRYAVILREEAARSVESPAAVDEQLHYLLAAAADG